MAQEKNNGTPDLKNEGVALKDLAEGTPVVGEFGDDEVMLVRDGRGIHATGASCSHWHGPLAEGVVVDGQAHCPWHHARFDLATGEPTNPPALRSLPVYQVETRDDRVFVTGRREVERSQPAVGSQPSSIVVVGSGAAGSMAVETLRDKGFTGELTLISAEEGAPQDRPNLSKGYMAGSAPEEWIPLRSTDAYRELDVELMLGRRVVRLDPDRQQIRLDDGTNLSYGALLLATGSTPRTLDVPGGEAAHVHTLRNLADARQIVEQVEGAKRVAVVGASFIGLEVAGGLRQRDVEVTVVAPEQTPMARIFGEELGLHIQKIHEDQGVTFELGRQIDRIGVKSITLDNGTTFEANVVIAGVGVEPNTALAEDAGLRVDGGVLVDHYLQASKPWIWAAGDIVRWPDERLDRTLRVEHWVVAQRQGRVAALNMLGQREKFSAAPFFWTKQFNQPIAYVGWADDWDEIQTVGSIDDGEAALAYRKDGRILAVATLNRDRLSLLAERAMERGDDEALESLFRS